MCDKCDKCSVVCEDVQSKEKLEDTVIRFLERREKRLDGLVARVKDLQNELRSVVRKKKNRTIHQLITGLKV